MGGFAPAALFSENYLDTPHEKFLNTPLEDNVLADLTYWLYILSLFDFIFYFKNKFL